MFLLVLSAIICGFGTTIYRPALTALIVDNSEPEYRGTIFSFFWAAFDVGMTVAGILFGVIADLFGLRLMFNIIALVGFLGLLMFALIIKPNFTNSIRQTLILKKMKIRL